MNRTYRVSLAARSDLDGIWEYIAAVNPDAANRLLDKLYTRFALLAAQPHMGETRIDLRRDLRGTHVGNYAIYYCLVEDDAYIEIVRVVHVARDTREMF